MKKITFALLGIGNRGTRYVRELSGHQNEAEIAAIADSKRIRLDSINKMLQLPQERLFSSGEEMLEKERLADVMIIASQDRQHKAHALKALEKGYHLLLEKPISDRAEDCKEIVAAAQRNDRKIIVCHVLRYTVFYQNIKKLIDDGAIGEVKSIQAEEQIGYYHFAHSYVRGNWHKEADSSPMILAKCCHDMDLFIWLTGKKCERVSSFGSLDFFKKENCPAGAPPRCTDGCTVDCPFNARDFYFSRIPGWPSNVLNPEPTEENILKVLQTQNYGRCVYQMDNDVVDHQVVNLLLQDGVTVNFTASAFTDKQTRTIHVMGTKGDIYGNMMNKSIHVSLFGKETYDIDLTSQWNNFSGHGGGDGRMITDVIRYFRKEDFDSRSITTIERSVESHYVAFAAEESRRNKGEVVEMESFEKNI